MVLKSYAKINLSLTVNKKKPNGLHEIQSLYCLVDLFDEIKITKIINKKIDKISFYGKFFKDIRPQNNSISKILNILRKYKFISGHYNIRIKKKIPVFAGLGGGTSNAATILKYLIKKKMNKKDLDKIINELGSDLRLFLQNQGYLKKLKTVQKFKKTYKLHFLIVYPNVKCSTKKIFSKFENYSKKKIFPKINLKTKTKFQKFLKTSKNDLQSIVVKEHPIIEKILNSINSEKGCYLSRMTGSGSACYGLFIDRNCSKVALKKLKKKYPKFYFSIAKTI